MNVKVKDILKQLTKLDPELIIAGRDIISLIDPLEVVEEKGVFVNEKLLEIQHLNEEDYKTMYESTPGIKSPKIEFKPFCHLRVKGRYHDKK